MTNRKQTSVIGAMKRAAVALDKYFLTEEEIYGW